MLPRVYCPAQVSEVARKHGATRWQIYDWRRRFRQRDAFPARLLESFIGRYIAGGWDEVAKGAIPVGARIRIMEGGFRMRLRLSSASHMISKTTERLREEETARHTLEAAPKR